MKFKIMGKKGDAAFDYDTETAEVKFKELSVDMIPMERTSSGKNVPMERFREDVERITWFPKIAGG